MSNLNETFANYWRLMKPQDWPDPERELVFHPTRKWRFDFAWPAVKVAVEIHGGTFSRGRHVRGSGITSDCEKLREAQSLGWLVLPYTSQDMKQPADVVDDVVQRIIDRSN